MGVLNMPRVVTLWDTPAVTITRCMAANMERNGRQVNWGADRMDRLIAALEAQQEAGKSGSQA